MTTENVAAEGLRSGMIVMLRGAWVKIRSIEFGTRTKIKYGECEVTVEPFDQFAVLLKASGGYDFSDEIPRERMIMPA